MMCSIHLMEPIEDKTSVKRKELPDREAEPLNPGSCPEASRSPVPRNYRRIPPPSCVDRATMESSLLQAADEDDFDWDSFSLKGIDGDVSSVLDYSTDGDANLANDREGEDGGSDFKVLGTLSFQRDRLCFQHDGDGGISFASSTYEDDDSIPSHCYLDSSPVFGSVLVLPAP